MEEFKGTKGKWEVIEHSWSDTSIVCGDKTICTKSIYDECTEESQEQVELETMANFNLLASSKDLLDFAQDFVAKVESGRSRSTDSYKKAKLAINKALGL